MKTTIVLLCVALLTGCGSTVEVRTQVNTGGGEPRLKLIPVSIKSSPAESGWVTYSVSSAVENLGPQISDMFNIADSGTVETQEGYTYRLTTDDFAGGPQTWLPPHFRAMGVLFRFKAAQGAHPTKAKLQQYGELDLTKTENVIFPTDASADIKPLSVGLSVKNATIAFANLKTEGTHTWLDVTITNLDKGYNNDKAFPSCSAIDNTGHQHQLSTQSSVSVGPGKIITSPFYFEGPMPQEVLKGAVLICWNNVDGRTHEGTVGLFSLN